MGNIYYSKDVFNDVNELYNKCKKDINELGNTILLYNEEIKKYGGSSSFDTLTSDMDKYDIEGKGFNEAIDIIKELQKIIKKQNNFINEQKKELMRVKENQTYEKQKEEKKDKSTDLGKLDTKGIFDDEPEETSGVELGPIGDISNIF